MSPAVAFYNITSCVALFGRQSSAKQDQSGCLVPPAQFYFTNEQKYLVRPGRSDHTIRDKINKKADALVAPAF